MKTRVDKVDKLSHERRLWQDGIRLFAGVDEAGRGPLAGPVVAAAVMFGPGHLIAGVDDSKKLKHEKRIELFDKITAECLDYGIGIIDAAEIDRINIYQATVLAMRKALEQLIPVPEHVLVDGRPIKNLGYSHTAVVKGDAVSFTMGAASIIAKVVRDDLMCHYARLYPVYGFDVHKGYGTPAHLTALKEHGPCAIHRRSFRVRALEKSAN